MLCARDRRVQTSKIYLFQLRPGSARQGRHRLSTSSTPREGERPRSSELVQPVSCGTTDSTTTTTTKNGGAVLSPRRIDSSSSLFVLSSVTLACCVSTIPIFCVRRCIFCRFASKIHTIYRATRTPIVTDLPLSPLVFPPFFSLSTSLSR